MSYQSAEKLAAGDPKTLRDAIEPRDLLGRQPDADQPFSWVSGSGHAVVIRHPHVKLCIFFYIVPLLAGLHAKYPTSQTFANAMVANNRIVRSKIC